MPTKRRSKGKIFAKWYIDIKGEKEAYFSDQFFPTVNEAKAFLSALIEHARSKAGPGEYVYVYPSESRVIEYRNGRWKAPRRV